MDKISEQRRVPSGKSLCRRGCWNSINPSLVSTTILVAVKREKGTRIRSHRNKSVDVHIERDRRCLGERIWEAC